MRVNDELLLDRTLRDKLNSSPEINGSKSTFLKTKCTAIKKTVKEDKKDVGWKFADSPYCDDEDKEELDFKQKQDRLKESMKIKIGDWDIETFMA